ncbi:unnamed protein product [Lathyrus oleraceus]
MFERGDGRGRWLRALEVTAKRESKGVCEKPKGVNACGDFGRWIRKGLLVVKKRRFERRRASRLVMAIHGEGLCAITAEGDVRMETEGFVWVSAGGDVEGSFEGLRLRRRRGFRQRMAASGFWLR